MASLTPGTVYFGNGAPSDASFPSSSPPDNVVYVDKLNGHLYVHACGAWLVNDVASASTLTFRRTIAAAAATVDLTTDVGLAPWAGTITAAKYIPAAGITGANTNTRTVTVYNLTTTKTAATLAFVSGTDGTINASNPLTVSGTAANVAVSSGDVVEFVSTHSGGSGLADPGGLVEITLTRTL